MSKTETPIVDMHYRNTMNKPLDRVVDEWMSAADQLFPKGTPEGCLIHAGKELKELIEAHQSGNESESLVECADVVMCMLTYLRRRGFTVNMLKHAIAQKTVTNLRREWIDNGDGSYSHKKDPE